MKTAPNQSPKATDLLLTRAQAAGINAEVIQQSKPQHRRHHPLGSTNVPQKVISLNGIPMSVGQAKEYVAARERKEIEK